MVLNFPKYPIKVKTENEKQYLFDIVRKKYVVASPEEWVRQHLLFFLTEERCYPKSMLAVEKGLYINELLKRSDLVVYDKMGSPVLLAECKAPHLKITQKVFDQIARYNMALKVRFLLITNGRQHYCCKLDFENGTYDFLPDIPEYDILLAK